MEDPTEFDLNEAIQRWQRELDQSPHFNAEAREELLAHLQDSLAKCCAAGLSAEEAFHAATRRIGPLGKLESEFAKEQHRRNWPTRLASFRTPFFLINLVASAWITPDGDPGKMVLLALPIQLLFEISVRIARSRRPKPAIQLEGD